MARGNTLKKRVAPHSETNYTERKFIDYLDGLDRYFASGQQSSVDKLQHFAKYVPRPSLARFLARYEIFRRIRTVQGSIVECGVFHGGGLMTWAEFSAILEPTNHQRRIIGFDTFEGFASISDKDRGSTSEFCAPGGLAADSFDDLQECIRLFDMTRYFAHIPKVELVRGDIKEAVPKYLEDNPHTVVSLLYVDVDLYEPALVALQQFLPRMPKGAIVAFDELNAPTFAGETRAVLEGVGIRSLRLERVDVGTAISFAVLD